MDRIDTVSFLGTSFIIAYVTDMGGIALVGMQAIWFGVLWIGKHYIDRWIDRKFAQ
jgi:hypothetical protein